MPNSRNYLDLPCEHICSCDFLKEHSKTADDFGDEIKLEYCFGEKTKCSRLVLREIIGIDQTPNNIKPGEWDKAKKIMVEAL